MPALCSRKTKLAAEPSRMGHLVGRDVDVEVVEPQPGDGRQQVLDGLDLGRARITARRDGRRHAGVADRLGRHRNVHRLRQVDAPEDQTGVRCGRPQGQFDLLATVETDADGTGQRLEGALLQHGRILGSEKARCPLEDTGPKREAAGGAGVRLSRPACAGRPGSRSRPCRWRPAHRPWPKPGCDSGARRWARWHGSG